MAVRLIDRRERLEYVHGDSTFYYRRMPLDKRSELLQKNTERGVLREGEFTRACLAWCVLGWDNVVDGEGNTIPYEEKLADYIPDSVQSALLRITGSAAEVEADERKNSQST